jgi:hypothetical protein
MATAVSAGDRELGAGLLLEVGRELPQVGDERVGRLLLRAALRDDGEDRRGAAGQQCGLREGHVVQAARELPRDARRRSAHGGGDPPDRLLRRCRVEVLDEHDEGAVEARAEVLADQLVGPALRAVRCRGGVVGQGQLQLRRREGEDGEGGEHGQDRDQRPAGYQARPSRAH